MMLSESEIYRRVAAGEMSREEALKWLRELYAGGGAATGAVAKPAPQEPAARPVQLRTTVGGPRSVDAVQRELAGIVQQILHLAGEELDADITFKELGADSISSVEIIRDANKAFGLSLDAVVLYDYATIRSLAAYVVSQSGAQGTMAQATTGVTAVQGRLTQIVGQILHLGPEELAEDLSFRELGADSISSVEIVRDINKQFGLNLDAVILYDYATIRSLSQYVTEQSSKEGARVSRPAAEAAAQRPHQAVSAQEPPRAKVRPTDAPAAEALETAIVEIVSQILHLPSEDLPHDLSFREMGVDSISSVEIVRDINSKFGLHLDAVVLYDHPTISSLAGLVMSQVQVATPVAPAVQSTHWTGDTLTQPASPTPERPKITLPEKKKGLTASGSPTQAASPAPKVTPATIVIPARTAGAADRSARQQMCDPRDVAIIGMSGRFPGASNVQEFWANLRDGVDSIREVPGYRWNIDHVYDPNPLALNKTNCRMGGFLDDVEMFDPLFFNISPKEAAYMDPQQRVFLQEAWKALEDAGYSDRTLSSTKCGVFVGAGQGDYTRLLGERGLANTGEAFTGLSAAILSGRISYFLNLTGPSISIDTACSSSLVAIHLACQSIRTGESDMALAGGVALMLTPDMHIKTSMIEMISPTGKCRAFDQSADGAVFGEGVAVIVLKSLQKATADRDHIYGVIKGSGINQDGKSNGITAPSAASQTRLELEVYRRYGINPGLLSYVEAHGTGTPLGDPIEIKALKEAFETYTERKQFCAIGSVKTNIGHAGLAAGVSSVIKVLLAMKHKQLPKSLHFVRENEHIRFRDTPFYVNTELTDWETEGNSPRMAAVSAFGFSGTNCHLVIEEAPRI